MEVRSPSVNGVKMVRVPFPLLLSSFPGPLLLPALGGFRDPLLDGFTFHTLFPQPLHDNLILAPGVDVFDEGHQADNYKTPAEEEQQLAHVEAQ